MINLWYYIGNLKSIIAGEEGNGPTGPPLRRPLAPGAVNTARDLGPLNRRRPSRSPNVELDAFCNSVFPLGLWGAFEKGTAKADKVHESPLVER